MIWVFGFMGLFLIGGLTGLFTAALGLDVHIHDTYFVVAHFHYIMVGGAIMGYFAGLHFWWPKMTGRMYSRRPGASSRRVLVFVGFNMTFFPQFILGYLGMPRRYHMYPPEFQVLNVLSTAGATVLAVGYLAADAVPHLLVLQGREGRRQSVAGHRPRMDDAVAAAAAQLHRPAGGDRRRLRVLEAGDQSCLTRCRHADAHGARARRHHPAHQHHFETMEQQDEASTLGMWIFLVTEVMFFGGLFMAYLLYRVWYPQAWSEGSHELTSVLGGINTVVLIGSSLTMALAVRAAQTGSAPRDRSCS